MASIKPGNIFKYVSSDITVSFIFWAWMFGFLASSHTLQEGGFVNKFGAVNPFVLFGMGFLGLGFLAYREIQSFSTLKDVLGFRTNISGFGILSFIVGIGIGDIVFELITNQLLTVGRSGSVMSSIQPFYNPFTASATGFTIGLHTFLGIALLNTVVSFSEENYKIIIYKNLSNGLDKITRKYNFLPSLSITSILIISLFITLTLWTGWHFFAWTHYSLVSIPTGIIYGLIFYSGSFLVVGTNLIPSKSISNDKVENILASIIVWPAIGSHLTWDTLQSLNKYYQLNQYYQGVTLVTAGLILVIVPLAIMYSIRKLNG